MNMSLFLFSHKELEARAKENALFPACARYTSKIVPQKMNCQIFLQSFAKTLKIHQ